MNGATTVWTQELVEKLLDLHKTGLSAAEIAGHFRAERLTRSAILGKIHRLRKERALPESTLRHEQAARRRALSKVREAKREARRLEREERDRRERRAKVLRYVNRGHHLLLCETLADEDPAPARGDLEIAAGQRKTLLELENHHCRFPIGEVGHPDFFYCGGPTADVLDGRPYCAVHAARAFIKPAVKPRNRGAQNRSDATRHWREEEAA